MTHGYRIPVILEPQPEGGYTVTSPDLPELLTEGDTVEEALHNVDDAFAAVLEIYEDEGRALPAGIVQDLNRGPIRTERFVANS
jgi:antitoxin HicB